MRILIPGAAGASRARSPCASKDEGHEVVGIDRRPWPDAPIEFHQVDIRKRAAEDVFRKVAPEAVVHMATVTSLVVPGEERYRINLGGTRAVFEHARAYGVEHCIFVGRHTFYGAGPDSPLFHTEDEPPLELNRFPELADLVAADLYAADRAVALSGARDDACCASATRSGPGDHGTLATFLAASACRWCSASIRCSSSCTRTTSSRRSCCTLEKRLRGVFNVAGPQPLPLSRVISEAGRDAGAAARVRPRGACSGASGFPQLPTGALTHIKYPVVVDAQAFRQATGFEHARTTSSRPMRELP